MLSAILRLLNLRRSPDPDSYYLAREVREALHPEAYGDCPAVPPTHFTHEDR